MALFNKIFSTSKKKSTSFNGLSSSSNTISPFPFSTDQVRVVLFRECDWRGTKLLFDSEAFVKVQTSSKVPNTKSTAQQQKNGESTKDQFQTTVGHLYELSDGVSYKYCRPQLPQSEATNQLSEMIFGSVALAFRGTTFKVHWLESPPRIMCSQVFLAPVQQSPSTMHPTPRSSQEYGDYLEASGSLNSISLSLCVNKDDIEANGEGDSSTGGDSGYSGDPLPGSARVSRSSLGSLFSDFDACRKFSVDSMESASSGSMQRRISRHLSTSLENRLASADSIGQLGELQWTGTYASELSVPKLRRNSEIMEKQVPEQVRKRNAVSGDTLAGARRSHTRRPRLGIAVCFSLHPQLEKEMKLFCSEHMIMLEGMVNRIRAAVEDAYISRHKFLHIMLNAWHAAANWLVDLFTAPRIANPVWLSLSGGYIKNATMLANAFMKDLNVLMTQTDTKDTNFFFSRLLTGVLSCHLAWVNTVAPITGDPTAPLDRDDSDASLETLVNEERHKLSEISKYHPYNALWAQLGDLYGAIGSPVRVAKTVLSGTDQRLVERLLNVLTYFIRCGEIKRHRLFHQLDRDVVRAAVSQSKRISKEKIVTITKKKVERSNAGGLRRTGTTVANLAGLSSISALNIPEEPCDVDDDDTTENVVFVLGGDNEALVGLKETAQTVLGGAIKKADCCSRTHKKHSGVKFNFEQYPQIATTYMKNKNLELNNYEFMEKTHKMELQWKLNYDLPSTSKEEIKHCKEEEEECECCRGMDLQTPSNASELEFTTEDLNACHEKKVEPPKIVISDPGGMKGLEIFDEAKELCFLRVQESVQVCEVPFQNDTTGQEVKSSKLLPGFMPSLFVGISNHYIPDMVLQGIITEQSKWEDNLKHDLMLSARCTSLEQVPTENVAIVASIDKWDVRMFSSYTQQLSTSISNSKTYGLVGMSQLVSTLLETVQTMWAAGATPFQCMSFIEAKLQEIYLQSEALASFLLATEFCSLNLLTTALELTDNDIPLLLAVASIHSPQVTKKYGISSR